MITIIKGEDAFYSAQKKYKEKNKKLNPVTRQGKVSRCAICDSKMHFAKNCQHKHQQNAQTLLKQAKKKQMVNIKLRTLILF